MAGMNGRVAADGGKRSSPATDTPKETTLRRHIQLASGRRTRLQPGSSQGPRTNILPLQPRQGHDRRLRRNCVAAVQAGRDVHPDWAPVLRLS
jgi:hypothetical protein